MHPSTKLDRIAAAKALSDADYLISPATLAGLGHRGGGPAYDIFNGRARYAWGDLLEWAEARVKKPRHRVRDVLQPEPAQAA